MKYAATRSLLILFTLLLNVPLIHTQSCNPLTEDYYTMSDASLGTQSIFYTGATKTITLPEGTNKITFRLWGGGGSGGGGSGPYCTIGAGGGGGYVKGTIMDLPSPVTLQIGKGGYENSEGNNGDTQYRRPWFDAGGVCNSGSWTSAEGGAGGASTTLELESTPYAVAGGGGGGACYSQGNGLEDGGGGGFSPELRLFTGQYQPAPTDRYGRHGTRVSSTGNKCPYAGGGGGYTGGTAQSSHQSWQFVGAQGGTSYLHPSVVNSSHGSGVTGGRSGGLTEKANTISGEWGDTAKPGHDGAAYLEFFKTLPARCNCKSGYYRNGANCNICPSGFYCPGGYSEDTQTACTGIGKTSDAGATADNECYCAIGYTTNGDNCDSCPINQYCIGKKNLNQHTIQI